MNDERSTAYPTVSVIHVVNDHVETPLRRVELHVVRGVGDDKTHQVSRSFHSLFCFARSLDFQGLPFIVFHFHFHFFYKY